MKTFIQIARAIKPLAASKTYRRQLVRRELSEVLYN